VLLKGSLGGKTSSSVEWARASVQTWSQIVGGYLSPSEAYSAGMLVLSQPHIAEILDDLFPKYYPFTTVAERF